MTDSQQLGPDSSSVDGPMDVVLKLQPTNPSSNTNYTLIGRLMGSKILNRDTVQSLLQKVWNFGGRLITSCVGPNT